MKLRATLLAVTRGLFGSPDDPARRLPPTQPSRSLPEAIVVFAVGVRLERAEGTFTSRDEVVLA